MEGHPRSLPGEGPVVVRVELAEEGFNVVRSTVAVMVAVLEPAVVANTAAFVGLASVEETVHLYRGG